MNKDNAKLYLPLVQALADGKVIQMKTYSGIWADVRQDVSLNFSHPASDYRIKPEPQKVHAVVRQNGSIAKHFHTWGQAEAMARKWNMAVGEKAYTVKTFTLVEENNDGNC